MSLITARSDGTVSYDEFIAKMDTNIRQRRNSLNQFVEEEIYAKIAQCLQQAGESLYQAMKVYDNTHDNTIQARDLTRVFKRLGLQSIEPHLPLILKTGGIRLQD
jgi:Ca2+-binding EF-hand superfamily protein